MRSFNLSIEIQEMTLDLFQKDLLDSCEWLTSVESLMKPLIAASGRLGHTRRRTSAVYDSKFL